MPESLFSTQWLDLRIKKINKNGTLFCSWNIRIMHLCIWRQSLLKIEINSSNLSIKFLFKEFICKREDIASVSRKILPYFNCFSNCCKRRQSKCLTFYLLVGPMHCKETVTKFIIASPKLETDRCMKYMKKISSHPKPQVRKHESKLFHTLVLHLDPWSWIEINKIQRKGSYI